MIETVESLNKQAIELVRMGEFDQAISCFQKAIRLEKTNYLLWYHLGATYREAGDLTSAKAALEQATTLNSEDIELLNMLAVTCYDLDQVDEAMALCNESLNLNSEDPIIWNTIGVIFFKNKNYNDASSAFEKAVTLNPYYYDALFNLRDTYDELGNTTGKSECINRMKSLEKEGFVNA